jgi:hypothetical protein
MKFGVGQPVRRHEDLRLIRGQGVILTMSCCRIRQWQMPPSRRSMRAAQDAFEEQDDLSQSGAHVISFCQPNRAEKYLLNWSKAVCG